MKPQTEIIAQAVEPQPLIDVHEAARLLAVTPRTIYKWIEEADRSPRPIPFKRLSAKLIRFERAELLKWANGGA